MPERHAIRASLPPAYIRIWNATRRIPRGRVSTYGAIAALAGLEGQPRLAGYALHNLPPGLDIPWQRVINARGMISLTGKAGARQRILLEKEGVVFRKKKVDLGLFGWPSIPRL
jgi:methylated-DNA-protein-cysteine methyltransferase-like protein